MIGVEPFCASSWGIMCSCLGCVEPLPMSLGTEIFQVDLALCYFSCQVILILALVWLLITWMRVLPLWCQNGFCDSSHSKWLWCLSVCGSCSLGWVFWSLPLKPFLCAHTLSTHSSRGRNLSKSSWYEPWFYSDERLDTCWIKLIWTLIMLLDYFLVMSILLRWGNLFLRWAFWFDGFSGLHVGIVTLRVVYPLCFLWFREFLVGACIFPGSFQVVLCLLLFGFRHLNGFSLLLSNHLLAMHSSRGRLRNQVDMCLGLYMMSDWPDDLKLCVCRVVSCFSHIV